MLTRLKSNYKKIISNVLFCLLYFHKLTINTIAFFANRSINDLIQLMLIILTVFQRKNTKIIA